MNYRQNMHEPRDNLVFVYGTLKKNGRDSSKLNGATWICNTITRDLDYDMLNSGNAPVVTQGYYAIEGELYAVSDKMLEDLDKLELNGVYYEKKLVKLLSGHVAWMYFLKSRLFFEIKRFVFDLFGHNTESLYEKGSVKYWQNNNVD